MRVHHLFCLGILYGMYTHAVGIREFGAHTSTRLLQTAYMTSQRYKGTKIGNPCIDGVFQYAFSDPFVASSFLNTVLDLHEGASITDLVFLPRLPSSNPLAYTGYNFTVDVKCKTKDGRHFLVEMQNDFREDYHLKALIEHSRMIGRMDLDGGKADELVEKSSSRKFWQSIQGIYSVILTNKAFSQTRHFLKQGKKNDTLSQ